MKSLMLTNRLQILAGMLVIIVSVACSSTVDYPAGVSDVSENSVQPPTGSEYVTSKAETATPVDDENSTPASVVTTTAVTTTSVLAVTTAVDKPLSPAWVEARQLVSMSNINAIDDEFADYLQKENDYWSNNPNSLSTPVGSLCWAFHEITRSGYLVLNRHALNEESRFMANLIGLVIEDGDRDPTDVLLEFLVLDLDTIAETRSVEGLSLESAQALALYRTPWWLNWIRQRNELAGDGTEWMTALRAVSAPEIEATIKAEDGLPTGAQQFSDVFFDAVAENLESGKTDPEDFHESEFDDPSVLPGYDNFIEVVKYAPDCQRMYGLSWQDRPIEDPALDVEPGDATTTQTTLAYGGIEPSPAWIEQQKWSNITQFDGSDEHLDYVLVNPNKRSTPMGALCWAHLETEQAIIRYLARETIDNEMILPYIESLGLQPNRSVPETQATAVLRQLLGSQDSSDENRLASVKISEEYLTISQEELSRLKDDWRSTVEPLDKIGGDGTEWLDMLREVAKPEVEAATRMREGLYAPAREYADALFKAVSEYLDGTRNDLLDEGGLSSELPNWNGFVQIASLSQDCQRAWLDL